MTPLRRRMLDALILRGLAERTQEAYIGAVVGPSKYYRRSPGERKLARSSVNQYSCAFRFLCGNVLGLDGAVFQIPLAPAPQRLPEILSRAEIAQLLACAPHAKARMLLSCAYPLGLRVAELCALRVEHIDSAADRMCVRVVQGKGARDRYVPLAEDLLASLREYWRAARPRPWLFPAAGDASRPQDIKSAQRWYHRARDAAGITKQGGIHTLRHCHATHLLEAGVDLHSLSQWLGHRYISTTSRYLHLARPDTPDGARRAPLKLLAALPPVPPSPATH